MLLVVGSVREVALIVEGVEGRGVNGDEALG